MRSRVPWRNDAIAAIGANCLNGTTFYDTISCSSEMAQVLYFLELTLTQKALFLLIDKIQHLCKILWKIRTGRPCWIPSYEYLEYYVAVPKKEGQLTRL